MENLKVGQRVWVVIDEEGVSAFDRDGVLEAAEPAVSVLVAPATVLEGGETAELTTGTRVDLLPDRTFHTIEEAELAAERLAKAGR